MTTLLTIYQIPDQRLHVQQMNLLRSRFYYGIFFTWLSLPAISQVASLSEITIQLAEGNYETVENLCEEKLNYPDLIQSDRVETLYHLSVAYHQMDNPKLAKSLIEKAYDISNSYRPKKAAEAILQINVANNFVYHLIADFEFTKGLKIANKTIQSINVNLNEDHELLIETYLRKIALLRMTAQIDSALFYIGRSKELLKNIHHLQADQYSLQILSEEAATYSDNHELRKSIPIYKKIIEIAGKKDNTEQLAVFYNNLGIAYMRMGDYGSCKSSLLKSLSYYRNQTNQHTPTLVSGMNNLALANIYLEKYSEAESYFLELLELITREHGSNHLRNGYTYRNLGLSMFHQDSFNKAELYYKKALAIFKENLGTTHDEVADTKRLLGTTCLKKGEKNQGEFYLTSALNDWSKLRRTSHEGLTETLAELAHMYYKQGDYRLSQEFLHQGYKSLRYCPDTPFYFDPLQSPLGLVHLLKIQLRSTLDEWLTCPRESPDKNIDHLFQVCDSLSQFIKYRFDDLATRRKIHTHMKWMQAYRLEYLYTIKEKQNTAPSQIFNTFEKSSNVFLYEKNAENNLNRWLDMPLHILDRKKRLADSLSSYLRIIDLHKKEENSPHFTHSLKQYNTYKDSLENLISEIKTRYPTYYHTLYNPNLVSLKDVQRSLPEESVAISYFLGDNYAYALIVKNRDSKLLQLAPAPTIRDKVNTLTDLLHNKGRTEEILSICEELGRLLLQDLDLTHVENLTIIPDGILGQLPFELLRINNQNLLSQTKINYVYAHTIHLNRPKSGKIKQALFMAPVFDDIDPNLLAADQITRKGRAYLPATKKEVTELAKIFGTEPYLFQDATKSTFQSLAAEADLIHLATHGVIDLENPDLSHLHFYPGSPQENKILHAGEIVNMKLKADLITLSACNTGTGKIQHGEGISSLGRAFAYSGVTNQVISLWPVHDESTRKIMTYYYKNLKKGMGKGTALTVAKQQYLKQSPKMLQHPYYWAGLVYYGADTPIYFERNPIYFIFAIAAFALLCFGWFFIRRE